MLAAYGPRESGVRPVWKCEKTQIFDFSAIGSKEFVVDAGMRYQFGAQIFVVDVKESTLWVSDKARALEFLYGYAVAQDIIRAEKQTSASISQLIKTDVERINPQYIEACERTRVDEDVSTYPHRNCPNCEHGAQDK